MSVIISGSFVLNPVVSGGEAVNGDNPLFGYRNLVTSGVLTTTTANPSFPTVNLANSNTYSRWEGTSIVADEYITMALATAELVDYVGIARHNFYTAQIAVSLEIFNGSIWVEVVAPFIPGNSGPIIMRFTPQAILSIRVRLQPGTAVPSAAVVFAGPLLVSQRRLYVGHSPISYSKKTKVVTGRSESGNFLGRIITNSFLQTTVDLDNLTADWFRTYLAPFIEAAREDPFFFAWRPLTYPNEVGYSWLMNDPTPHNQRANGMMKISLEIGSIA